MYELELVSLPSIFDDFVEIQIKSECLGGWDYNHSASEWSTRQNPDPAKSRLSTDFSDLKKISRYQGYTSVGRENARRRL